MRTLRRYGHEAVGGDAQTIMAQVPAQHAAEAPLPALVIVYTGSPWLSGARRSTTRLRTLRGAYLIRSPWWSLTSPCTIATPSRHGRRFAVDTSGLPHTDLRFKHGPDLRSFTEHPFLFGEERPLLQLPPTRGFIGRAAALAPRLFALVENEGPLASQARGALAQPDRHGAMDAASSLVQSARRIRILDHGRWTIERDRSQAQ